MGEPLPEDPAHAAVVNEVDKNMRLEQGYFAPAPGEAAVPPDQRDFPLGLAVAASAAVPGVFQPLAISGMYEGIRVRLVDGGVQDNQGIQGSSTAAAPTSSSATHPASSTIRRNRRRGSSRCSNAHPASVRAASARSR